VHLRNGCHPPTNIGVIYVSSSACYSGASRESQGGLIGTGSSPASCKWLQEVALHAMHCSGAPIQTTKNTASPYGSPHSTTCTTTLGATVSDTG
jgi:hypothetical protein